jgi:GH35 family endo-1,4-beta-xylanase
MKNLYRICLLTAVLTMVTSCAEGGLLDFEYDKPQTIANQEEIDAYADLKTYVDRAVNPDFKLGAGIMLNDYTSKSLVYRLVNRNFDEITLGYEMKHGAVVQSDGSLALDNVNKLLTTAAEANVSVFGHTLCWHSNQNAAYLNRLIEPLVVVPPAIANSLDLTNLKAGSFTGWTKVNSGAGISIENDKGMAGTGSKAIKLVSSVGSSQPDALELASPSIPVITDHTYEVIFYIKSDVAGEGRVSFEGLDDNVPMMDWTGTGIKTKTFQTTASWQQVKFKVKNFNAGTFKVKLDLGYKSDVKYNVDVDNFYVYDTQGAPAFVNLISNGDFEAGNINGWNGWGLSSSRAITSNGEGYGGTGYAIAEYNPTKGGGFWEVQTSLETPVLEKGVQYLLTFYVKSTDTSGRIWPEFQSNNWWDGADGMGIVYLSNSWKKVELTVTPTTDSRNHLVISFGDMAGTVYMDNFVLRKAAGGSSAEPLTVEKLPEVKKEIIGNALENWISKMVTNCKDYVKAWDVVNEPMDDGSPYALKTGVGKTLAQDEFYWQDYLGKDYAVNAFKLAKKYGNTTDKLFINDYNLEYNLDKCKGLIDYVIYIESKGAKVDGIATQMHINIYTSKDKIAQMFQLLAATGKLVKVSELDVNVPVKNPSVAMLNSQAEMYKYVVDMYMKYVPVNQRYGITVWGLTDSSENASWLPGAKQGLWDINFTRKPAYARFADGLKGAK